MCWRVIIVGAIGSLVVSIVLIAAVVTLRVLNRPVVAQELPRGFTAGYDGGRFFIRHDVSLNLSNQHFRTPPGPDVEFGVALLGMGDWMTEHSAHWDRMGVAWSQEYQLRNYVMGAWQVDQARTLSMRFEYLVIGPMLLGWISWRIYSRSRRQLIRSRRGLCRTCGYDLRASQGRCPECGTSFVESG